MFIPLHDANGLKHIHLQYVTLGLIAANVIIFALTSMADARLSYAAVFGFGYIPSVAFDHAVLPGEFDFVPTAATYVTYSFLHADVLHLGGNMLFLWVFGDNVEDALGHFRFLVFYILCAAAGAYMHGVMAPESSIPLIGASGGIAGIVAAYLMLHPMVRVWVLAFARIPLRIPAWIVLAIWIALQFGMLLIAEEDQISWASHVGGILMGAFLVLFMRRRGVPLFDREIVTPDAVETTGGPRRRPPGVPPPVPGSRPSAE